MSGSEGMRFSPWCGALWVGTLGLVFAEQAMAEEDVRIAIASGARRVEIGGRALAFFDADVGDELVRLRGETVVTVLEKKGALELRARGKKPLGARRVLVEGKDGIRVGDGFYFGRVQIEGDRKSRLRIVNRLPLEVYLLGIVGSEMHAAWPLEALKAQAVAARTYAMHRRTMMRARNSPFDLSSTVLSQVYKGAEDIAPSVVRAVKETRGELMGYHHDVVEALYHSTCGGQTVSARRGFGKAVPYLIPRICHWCRASTKYRWRLSLPLWEVSRALKKAGLSQGKLQGLHRPALSSGLRLTERGRKKELSPNALRKAVGYGRVFSDRFTAFTRGAKVHMQGRGFGHGVGMCQWGARGMALGGKTYRQILRHYYPGVRIQRIY